MNVTLKNDTHVGLGFAVQYDPFQSGREAAQMAKSHLPEGTPSLVLALGPSNPHFHDFIEGVRLVTGEDALIGIPTDRVVSKELFSPQTCVVVILQSSSNQFSMTSAAIEGDNLLSPITTLFTKLRSTRGNTRHQYENHGLLLFQNGTKEETSILAQNALADVGLESWLISGIPHQESVRPPFVCHDQILPTGLVGIECLSNNPWGSGLVDISSFKNQPHIYGEAVKTALRDALGQMGSHPVALGLLLFNAPLKEFSEGDLSTVFSSGQSLMQDIPLVGMSLHSPLIRCQNQSDLKDKQSITALLFPQ